MNKLITIEQLEANKALLLEYYNSVHFHEVHNIQKKAEIDKAVADVNNSIKALRSWE